MEKNNVIQFNNGKVSEGINQREREAIFSLYQEKREEKENYNPLPMIAVCITIAWFSIYGFFCAVRDFIYPLFELFF